MRNPEGDRNNWFGWTEAENGKLGWASPLDARGGDDYGSFGGGTPNCNGAYGSPPGLERRVGLAAAADAGRHADPRTPAQRPDADRDGCRGGCRRLRRHSTPRSTRARRRWPATASTRTAAAPTLAGQADGDRRLQLDQARLGRSRSTACGSPRPRRRDVRRHVLGPAQGLPEGEDLHDRRQGQRLDDQALPQAAAQPRGRHHHGDHAQHGRARQALHEPARKVALADPLPRARCAEGDEMPGAAGARGDGRAPRASDHGSVVDSVKSSDLV